ncbi:hypothetical protein FNV43_RR08200 [Rhamnella rubrinervis]|uniref:HMA domain-containing protein n=1 Tax=Rhamnella rubrinervis TaxID=2594499 RepID=A0A8K0HHC8_9ROSA|nr:hypothetical protein FNV43_RR08200 [Rhamnella rubrinervis]
MLVHMDCTGCETKIKKALRKLEGVDDVDVNMNMQKVTVMGWAKEKKVLKTVRKTGRKAELWPYSYTPEYHHNLKLQYNNNTQQSSSISLSNYYQNGFNYITNDNGYEYNYDQQVQPPYSTTFPFEYEYNYDQQVQPPYSTTFPFEYDQARSMFSDENPHACSIM